MTIYPDIRSGAHSVPIERGQIYLARLFGALIALSILILSHAALARGAPDSFADLAERLTPAVVSIRVTQNVGGSSELPDMMPEVPPGSPLEDMFRDFFERQQRGETPQQQTTALGSGFIVDEEGYIVTNNHVIADADEIIVRLADESEYVAELVGTDPKLDIALLKIDAGGDLPIVVFGDSDEVRIGDWVLAIGNPFGVGITVTAGIISARGRDIRSGPYDDFLQTDAPINKGNSGGPLFNMDGDVIGVNTAIWSPSGGSVGIGFSVPSIQAQAVVAQLREYGRTVRGWLGVRIQSVDDDIAESLGLESARGALVADVTPDSPAADAGIETGDVILRFNDRPVPEMQDLPRLVASTPVNSTVDVVVLRKGQQITLPVSIGELDEAAPQLAAATPVEPETTKAESLGMTFSAITPEMQERFGVDGPVRGVVVIEVDPNGAAAERGIRPGDVVLEVGLEEVTNPAEVVERVEEARKAMRKSVLLLVERGGDQRFVAVEIDQS